MKVLLVEDEPDIRLITSLALEDDGHYVVAVGDGLSALEWAQAEPFDVVLLDVMLPQIDGFTICARLKSHPPTAHLPVIFLTARSQETEVRQGLSIGAKGYIVKPYDIFTLSVRVAAILDAQEGPDGPVSADSVA
jgi:DNA-binding response OmpR family regulator